jgi:hypothetical protein
LPPDPRKTETPKNRKKENRMKKNKKEDGTYEITVAKPGENHRKYKSTVSIITTKKKKEFFKIFFNCYNIC